MKNVWLERKETRENEKHLSFRRKYVWDFSEIRLDDTQVQFLQSCRKTQMTEK